MTKELTHDFEKNLEKALKMRDEGKSIPEILRLFPTQKKEFADIFGVVHWMSEEGQAAVPSERILENILKKIKPIEEEKIVKQVFNFDSKMKIVKDYFGKLELGKNIWFPLGSVAVLLLVIVIGRTPSAVDTTEPIETQSLKMATVSTEGSASELVAAFPEGSADIAFLQSRLVLGSSFSDVGPLESLAQTYHENEI